MLAVARCESVKNLLQSSIQITANAQCLHSQDMNLWTTCSRQVRCMSTFSHGSSRETILHFALLLHTKAPRDYFRNTIFSCAFARKTKGNIEQATTKNITRAYWSIFNVIHYTTGSLRDLKTFYTFCFFAAGLSGTSSSCSSSPSLPFADCCFARYVSISDLYRFMSTSAFPL